MAIINYTNTTKNLNSLFETGEDLHILVMNVESLSTKKGVAFAESF